MKTGHCPSEVIAVQSTGPWPALSRSEILLKSDRLRVVRIVLSAGASLKEHTAPGDLLVQCVQGKVTFSLPQQSHVLQSGELIHVPDRLPHSVEALEDSQLLLTISLDS